MLTNSDTQTCIHKRTEFVLLRKLTSGHDMLIFSLPQYHIQVRHYSSQWPVLNYSGYLLPNLLVLVNRYCSHWKGCLVTREWECFIQNLCNKHSLIGLLQVVNSSRSTETMGLTQYSCTSTGTRYISYTCDKLHNNLCYLSCQDINSIWIFWI